MAKTKKTFDKELMYKKIMPSNIKKNNDNEKQEIEDVQDELELQNEIKTKIATSVDAIKFKDESSMFQNKEINVRREEKDEVILYNITEKLVLNKLDSTLKKMNCCKCDRCKKDVVALALNNLKPIYVVATKDEVEKKIKEYDKIGLQVTTAVLKSALTVRKNPRH
ncbi:late competence development ComFB family protein [Sedimentibacter sp. MB31-C6]|uniref:late competence development ComFB family protein n=1 Tax=Sedimentibacter sp. MB31-C6 TaxID=3109366 RepID=UPI002DDD26F8|nr:late competence development ComFB family protein [Sedimentibacter sp. MB36-C1]WSI05010.1 late competence development ComFB family protein [Sedimentibacter sp. MB36-C1]